MSPANNKRSGFTMLEVVLAATITAMLVSAAVLVSQSVQGSYETSMTVSQVDSRARRAIWQIEERLRGTTAADIDPAPEAPASTSSIEFQRILRFEDPDPVWSETERIELEYMPGEVDDGVDNDGNGLIDDCRIVVVENVGTADEQTRVLCTGVAEFQPGEFRNGEDDNGNGYEDERGFAIDVTGDRLRIMLTIESVDASGALISRSMTRTIAFRARR